MLRLPSGILHPPQPHGDPAKPKYHCISLIIVYNIHINSRYSQLLRCKPNSNLFLHLQQRADHRSQGRDRHWSCRSGISNTWPTFLGCKAEKIERTRATCCGNAGCRFSFTISIQPTERAAVSANPRGVRNGRSALWFSLLGSGRDGAAWHLDSA
jgi:hypothetical protein